MKKLLFMLLACIVNAHATLNDTPPAAFTTKYEAYVNGAKAGYFELAWRSITHDSTGWNIYDTSQTMLGKVAINPRGKIFMPARRIPLQQATLVNTMLEQFFEEDNSIQRSSHTYATA